MSIIGSNWKNVMNDIANANIENISKIPYVGEKIAKKLILDLIFDDQYKDYNGVYLLCRKRELYMREDDIFTMDSVLNFRKFEE